MLESAAEPKALRRFTFMQTQINIKDFAAVLFLAMVFAGFVSTAFNFVASLAYEALLLSLFVLPFLLLSKNKSFEKLVLLTSFFFLAFALFAYLLYWHNLQFAQSKLAFSKLLNQKRDFQIQILQDLDRRVNYSFAKAQLCKQNACINVKAKFSNHLAENLSYKDFVQVTATLKEVENFNGFNYQNFLKAKNIHYLLDVHKIISVKEQKAPFEFLLDIKRKFKDALFALYAYNEAALASGILLGEKQALPPSMQDAFKVSGLMHIVVLSGFNITVLAGFIFATFFFVNRRLRALVAMFAVALFVFMVGFEMPTVRAAIMGSLSFLAIAFRRAGDLIYFFFLSGIIILFLNPFAAIWDSSFQMSFIVTLAILFCAVQTEAGVYEFSLKNFVKDLLASSVVAFLSVSPVLASFSGFVYPFSIFANLLVLPFVPAAMFFAFVSALLKLASLSSLAYLFAFFANAILLFIEKVALSLSSLPLAKVALSVSPAAAAMLYLFALALFVFWYVGYEK